MTVRLALVRPPSDELAAGERTFVERRPLDASRARAEHAGFCSVLADLGVQVRELPALPGLPDACFVEDPAVVLSEVAVRARMGASSRAAEVDALAAVLAEYREVISLPTGKLEGGDVLPLDDVLYVGLSRRTDHAGMRALAHAVLEHGLRVKAVDVRGALHLETGVTWLGADVLLANPEWVDVARFAGLRVLHVDPREPFGANVLKVGDSLVASAAHPRTLGRIVDAGFDVRAVEMDELHKAEAGPTCLVQLFTVQQSGP